MGSIVFIDPRLAPSVPLPDGFEYPTEFLRYLLLEEIEVRDSPDLCVLNWVWPFELHYQSGRVATVLAAHKAQWPQREDYFAVPFGQDAGDGIWFFTPDGIQFIDMAWQQWVPRPENAKDFLQFVNEQRAGSYLCAWQP